MSAAQFKIANRIFTGQGSVNILKDEICRLGVKNPLIVTDKILESVGVIDQIKQIMNGHPYSVFNGIKPEPEIEIAENCIKAFKDSKHDGLIAVGGGSTMDIAKVTSICMNIEGDITSLFKVNAVQKKGFPVVAIPTTAGTGSEVTNIAVLTDTKAQLKRGIVSDFIIPDVAIVSPEMTLTMPKNVTAASGVDALVHAIETYISLKATPVTDGMALQAIRMISRYLPKAYANGNDIIAREQMGTASLLAGMAFGNAGVAAVHALAFPLGGRFNIPHGVSNALLLPYVMEWNKICCMERFRDIAEAMGENVRGLSDHKTANLAVKSMKRLCRTVNIPEGLRSFNIPESAIPEMAEDASKIERLLKNNPRILSKEEIEAIYREAF